MVASIGVIASPAQGAGYFERDGYYAKDDPAHREASAWAGRGAEALGLSGPVDSGVFQAILEGRVPDGPHLGKRGRDGEIHHRPGRDVTMSAPKSVSLMALIGGDERIVAAHDRAVRTILSQSPDTVAACCAGTETIPASVLSQVLSAFGATTPTDPTWRRDEWALATGPSTTSGFKRQYLFHLWPPRFRCRAVQIYVDTLAPYETEE